MDIDCPDVMKHVPNSLSSPVRTVGELLAWMTDYGGQFMQLKPGNGNSRLGALNAFLRQFDPKDIRKALVDRMAGPSEIDPLYGPDAVTYPRLVRDLVRRYNDPELKLSDWIKIWKLLSEVLVSMGCAHPRLRNHLGWRLRKTSADAPSLDSKDVEEEDVFDPLSAELDSGAVESSSVRLSIPDEELGAGMGASALPRPDMIERNEALIG